MTDTLNQAVRTLVGAAFSMLFALLPFFVVLISIDPVGNPMPRLWATLYAGCVGGFYFGRFVHTKKASAAS